MVNLKFFSVVAVCSLLIGGPIMADGLTININSLSKLILEAVGGNDVKINNKLDDGAVPKNGQIVIPEEALNFTVLELGGDNKTRIKASDLINAYMVLFGSNGIKF